jgi:hypothetical protein
MHHQPSEELAFWLSTGFPNMHSWEEGHGAFKLTLVGGGH